MSKATMSKATMNEIRRFALGYELGKSQGITEVMTFLYLLIELNFDTTMLMDFVMVLQEGKEFGNT